MEDVTRDSEILSRKSFRTRKDGVTGHAACVGLIAAFIAAWILGATASATTYGTRVMIVVLIGLFAEIYIDLPYWNWYGLPMNYTIGHLLGGILSWAVAGLAMAAIVKCPAVT